MKKLIDDLLKSPSGKYSRKSVMLLVTFFLTMALGAYIVVAEVLNTYASGIFDSLLLFLFGLSGTVVADKKLLNKSVPNTTEEDTSGTEI